MSRMPRGPNPTSASKARAQCGPRTNFPSVGNHGVGNLQITGGGQVQTTAGDAVIGGSFGSTGSGSVVVDGPGSVLTLPSADPSGLYVGDDGPGVLSVTNGGTVSVTSFNGIQIGDQGTVMGDGTLDAWVYNHGIVAQGTSVGTLTIVNSPYRQGPTGTLEIELASATSYDKLNFPGGGAFLEGGTLDVTLLDGYSPSFGTSFDLMDWHQFGSITGTFATLNLPDLPGTLDWDTWSFMAQACCGSFRPAAWQATTTRTASSTRPTTACGAKTTAAKKATTLGGQTSANRPAAERVPLQVHLPTPHPMCLNRPLCSCS